MRYQERKFPTGFLTEAGKHKYGKVVRGAHSETGGWKERTPNVSTKKLDSVD